MDFYSSDGQPFAYCDDGETLFTYGGQAIGYIDGDSIYSFSGSHVAFWENGQAWDHSDCVVLFTDRAIGGPLKPARAMKPARGIKSQKPLKGLRALKPVKAMKHSEWSLQSAAQLFG